MCMQGFGYVEFGSNSALQKAVDLKDPELHGRKMTIMVSKPPSGGPAGIPTALSSCDFRQKHFSWDTVKECTVTRMLLMFQLQNQTRLPRIRALSSIAHFHKQYQAGTRALMHVFVCSFREGAWGTSQGVWRRQRRQRQVYPST